MGSRFANEIQCGQMSLFNSDSAKASQTHTFGLFPTQPNFWKSAAKYLGITITDYLDWAQHILEISSKTTKALGFPSQELGFRT